MAADHAACAQGLRPVAIRCRASIETGVPMKSPLPRRLLPFAIILSLAGCDSTAHAPSVPVFGSFFPAWIICALGGVVLALLVRILLIVLGLDEHLPAPPLVYLCLAISGGIGAWLVWSGAMG